MPDTMSESDVLRLVVGLVAANRENDTFFQIGFMMGIADCVIYACMDKIP